MSHSSPVSCRVRSLSHSLVSLFSNFSDNSSHVVRSSHENFLYCGEVENQPQLGILHRSEERGQSWTTLSNSSKPT